MFRMYRIFRLWRVCALGGLFCGGILLYCCSSPSIAGEVACKAGGTLLLLCFLRLAQKWEREGKIDEIAKDDWEEVDDEA